MAIRGGRTSVFLLSIPNRSIAANSLSSLSPVSDADDDALVSNAVAVLREQRSRTRWRSLRSLYHPTGFSPSQAADILRRLRNAPRLALRFFLWSHRRRLCHHDLRSYATAAHVLARSRLRAPALALLRSAIRSLESPTTSPSDLLGALVKTYRACDSTPFVFDLLITAYLDAGKLDRAVEIVRLLRSRGFHPLVSTVNSLIRSASRARGLDAGLAIYRELFPHDNQSKRASPNVHTFNILLLALHRAGECLNRAGEMRSEMERRGCGPNAFTYSVLMAGLCDDAKIREARNLWDEMAGKGIKPDIVAFNTLINGYCRAGEVGGAEELYRGMVFTGIEPTCTTFEHLIKGHCWAADLDSALLVYRDMKSKGFRPDVETIDELLDEMCRKGRAQDGLQILRDETGRDCFHPSRRSYEALIGGFCGNGEMEMAAKLQAEMAGKGFPAGSKVYSAFVKGYAEKGDVEMAERLREEMVGMGLEEQEYEEEV